MLGFLIGVLLTGAVLSDPDPREVLVRVDNDAITRAEVDREVRRALGTREADVAERAQLEKDMLALVVDRRLVLRYLERSQQAASSQDIDFALAQFVKQLGRQERTLAEYLAKEHSSEQELRRQFAWQLSWQRYLDKQLSDKNLEKYFEKHRRDFDGTEIHAAHVLWKVAPADEPALNRALAKAKSIREQIVAKKLDFADAARQYSQAPTAQRGGDLGWIRRHEPMPEVFSQAAFALDKDEISQPVVSPFGVHLIRVLDEKPGQATWQDCRDELMSAVTRYLFNFLAARERNVARVKRLLETMD
jgi:parvulin-like peptidyl-prolyl isomerase